MTKSFFILLLLLPWRSFSQHKDFLWDLKALHKSPAVEWIDQKSPVRSLLYASADYGDKPTQVFAYYSNPDLLAGRPSTGKSYPAVVLVHGGGGMAFKQWVEKWAANGYAAIAMDLSGHDGDGKKLTHDGPEQSDENKFQKIAEGNLKNVWTYHAIASVILAHSWLLNLPEVDAEKTGITGISWGGYLTCIAAGLDARFKVAVPVYGCGYYDESDVFKNMLNVLSPSDHQKWMTYFDPSAYLPYAKARFLFMNGNKDSHYNVMPYHKTYLNVNKTKRVICIKPDMQHSHVDGWEPAEIIAFFQQELYHKQQLVNVKKVQVRPTLIRLAYQSPEPLSQADFYYTNDVASKNSARIWLRQDALIDAKRQIVTTAQVPGGFKYGFFYLKDSKGRAVSSEFILK